VAGAIVLTCVLVAQRARFGQRRGSPGWSVQHEGVNSAAAVGVGNLPSDT
jgi:hypothetical protein